MSDYTNDDVRAAVAAIGRAALGSDKGTGPLPQAIARGVLDAVAPAIVRRAKAEALREYANDLAANDCAAIWQWPDFVSDAREYADSFRGTP